MRTETIIDRPLKMGRLSKDTSGNTVLLNPQGQAYAVNDSIIRVWEKLDGTKTSDQIVEYFLDQDQIQGPNQEEYSLKTYELIRKLKSVNLAS